MAAKPKNIVRRRIMVATAVSVPLSGLCWMAAGQEHAIKRAGVSGVTSAVVGAIGFGAWWAATAKKQERWSELGSGLAFGAAVGSGIGSVTSLTLDSVYTAVD